MADIASLLRTDFKAVDKREALNSVMGWLTGDSKKCPIIVDDGKPFGIVNDRAIMSRNLDPHTHVKQFLLTTGALPVNATLDEARARLAEYRASYLPVADEKGKLIGYVTAIDIARESLDTQKARDLAVPVTQLRETNTIGDALNAFTKEYIDYLPVLREDGRVTGILPRASVLRVEFNAGNKGRKDAGGEKLHLMNDPVAGFMDDVPHILPPTADRDTVLETLENVGYAIVGTLEHAEGIVTPETLFRPDGR